VSLWEALTGKLAYEGYSTGEVFTRVAAGDLPLPFPNNIPSRLKAILCSTLEHEYLKRPSFEALEKSLRQVRQEADNHLVETLERFFGVDG